MRWCIGKDDPYPECPRVTSRVGASLVGFHRWVVRRCEVCGTRKGLVKTKATLSVPRRDRYGAYVLEYVYMTRVCVGCLGDYYSDGTGV